MTKMGREGEDRILVIALPWQLGKGSAISLEVIGAHFVRDIPEREMAYTGLPGMYYMYYIFEICVLFLFYFYLCTIFLGKTGILVLKGRRG